MIEKAIMMLLMVVLACVLLLLPCILLEYTLGIVVFAGTATISALAMIAAIVVDVWTNS